MRVAVFASYLPPHVGGLEVVVDAQVKALVADGQDVRLVTSSAGAKAGRHMADGYEVRRVSAWNYLEDKWGAAFPIFSPSLVWYAFRAVKYADIVHTHDGFYLTSLAAAFWARVLRKPLILTQHVDLVPHPNSIVRLAQRLVYATTGRFVMVSSARIIVLNSRVKQFLLSKKVAEAHTVFLPNGVDTNAFKPVDQAEKQRLRTNFGVPTSQTVALFAGRFVPKKGFGMLLEVPPIPGLTWVFAGGYAPSGHTRRDHYFLGPVGREAMAEVFRMCDIFVLPSSGEGFPVTVQEAMASGLAVITTDDPAYSLYRLDRHYITLIEPTAVEIAKRLRSLRRAPDFRVRAGAYARHYAETHFAWNAHLQHLVQLYGEVARERTARGRL